MIGKPKSLYVNVNFNTINHNGENIIAINLKLFHLFFLENC